MSRITGLLVATTVTLALSTGFAPASGGAAPIWQVPVILDQPGAYYLSRNLAGSGFGAGVERVSVRGTAGDGIRIASGFEVLVPAHAVIRDNAVAEAGGRGRQNGTQYRSLPCDDTPC